MKSEKLLIRLTAILAAVAMPLASLGLELSVEQQIPGRYLLLTGVADEVGTDDKPIQAEFDKKCLAAEVDHCQLAIYPQGYQQGSGLAGVAESFSGRINRHKSPVTIFSPGDIEAGKSRFAEEMIGCYISPQDLYQAYEDNEVVADDDFKGKKLLMEIKINKVAKDALGNPYISVAADQHGFKSIHIQVDKNDPFLRKIKKGSAVAVAASPEGLVMTQVMMKGKILASDAGFLLDGKIFNPHN